MLCLGGLQRDHASVHFAQILGMARTLMFGVSGSDGVGLRLPFMVQGRSVQEVVLNLGFGGLRCRGYRTRSLFRV